MLCKPGFNRIEQNNRFANFTNRPKQLQEILDQGAILIFKILHISCADKITKDIVCIINKSHSAFPVQIMETV